MSYINEDLERTDESFYASKDTAKDMVAPLKCLLGKDKSKTCNILIASQGITVTVDEKASMQFNAYFKRNVFIDYDLRVDSIELRLPLHDLIEAISALSDQARLEIRFKEHGSPLLIKIQHENTRLAVAIKTYNAQNTLDFDFNNSPIHAKVLLLPKTFKEVIRDIDTNSTTVRFSVSNDELRIHYGGDLMKSTTVFPRYSREVCDLSLSVQETVVHQYNAILIKRMLPALRVTNKIGLRFDERGILNVQFAVPQEDKQTNFVQFLCVPDTVMD